MALDIGTLVGYLKLDSTGWDSGMRKAEGDQQGFGERSTSMMKTVAGTIAGVWAGLQVGQFFVDGINYASDLNETLNKSRAIFGEHAGAVEAFAKNAATNVGMSEQAALAAASSFGDMFTQIGFTGDAAAAMSQQVVIAAADLGSFSNLETADVADRISAAFRGEYDSLQAVIPNINAARVESEALAMTGKTVASELTAQEKAAAVLAIVQKDGARAMGDFAKTSDGYANSGKIAAAQMEELGGKIGALLLPALMSIQQILLDYVIPAFEAIVGFISENISWLGPLATGILIAVGAFAALVAVQWAWNVALTANPIGLIIVAIGLLIGAIILLVQNWDTVVAWLGTIWQGFVDWIVAVVDGFVAWWNSVWEGFAAWIGAVWQGFVDFIVNVWNGFVAFIMLAVNSYFAAWQMIWTAVSTFVTNVWQGFVAVITGIWSGFIGWINGVVSGFMGWWNGVWNGFVSFISGIWRNVVTGAQAIWNGLISWFQSVPGMIMGVFSGAGQWLYTMGRDVLNGLWNGLKSIWNNLVGWIEDIGGQIADVFAGILGIHSPSRVFMSFGRDTMRGYILGVEKMMPDVDATMASAVSLPDPNATSSRSVEPTWRTPAPSSKTINYYAAEHQSLSSREALFAALGSGRTDWEDD